MTVSWFLVKSGFASSGDLLSLQQIRDGRLQIIKHANGAVKKPPFSCIGFQGRLHNKATPRMPQAVIEIVSP
jgi:hypothetical protein